MLLSNGSGSCHFRLTFKMPTKKLIFNKKFSAYYFLKVYLHHFSKIKSQKESQNKRYQGFSYYFCMMIEGSGSIPLTSGSGSGFRRPKNMWILWIRIRNTGLQQYQQPKTEGFVPFQTDFYLSCVSCEVRFKTVKRQLFDSHTHTLPQGCDEPLPPLCFCCYQTILSKKFVCTFWRRLLGTFPLLQAKNWLLGPWRELSTSLKEGPRRWEKSLAKIPKFLANFFSYLVSFPRLPLFQKVFIRIFSLAIIRYYFLYFLEVWRKKYPYVS